jgi:hypothetical protein
MMQRRSSVERALCPARQFLQGYVMVFPAETEKRHLRPAITRGDLQAENVSVKALGFPQTRNIEDHMSEDAAPHAHGETLMRRHYACQEAVVDEPKRR